MPFVCKICEKCPTSHSLTKYSETPDLLVYYTCPAIATNNETDGIIYHYNGMLSEINGKNWIWILDLKDFGMKQFLEIGNAIALVKLITKKYSNNLKKIIVVNQNSFTTIIYKIIKPFLTSEMQNIIYFSDKKESIINKNNFENNNVLHI